MSLEVTESQPAIETILTKPLRYFTTEARSNAYAVAWFWTVYACMEDFAKLIKKGDLRILMQSDELVTVIRSQSDFDMLFPLMFHHEKAVASRAADIIEKLTASTPEFLKPHDEQLIALVLDHPNPELKWHLAHLITRLPLSENSFRMIWAKIRYWATNPNENKFVRVASLQALYDLMRSSSNSAISSDFKNIVRGVESEQIPSITARIKKLRKEFAGQR